MRSVWISEIGTIVFGLYREFNIYQSAIVLNGKQKACQKPWHFAFHQ